MCYIIHYVNITDGSFSLRNSNLTAGYVRILASFTGDVLDESTGGYIGLYDSTITAPIAIDFRNSNFINLDFYGTTTINGDILGPVGKLNTITFDDDALVLAEYSATVVGMQILYQQSRTIEENVRSATAVQMAISTLSYSELIAVRAIFKALEGDEGRLTASNIADEIGITRSVIVNALRKLESAGIIESRSLGMKGTYLKVLNHRFKEELNKA